MQWLLLVAVVLGSMALGTSLAGIVLPYWLNQEKDGLELYEGLWEICVKQPSATDFVCTPFDGSVTSTVRAVWSMEIIGVILISTALLLGILKLTAMKQRSTLPYASGIIQMFAGICITIGTLLYLLTVRDEKDPTHRTRNIDTGWFVTIGGGGAAFIFAIFFFAAARKAIDKK